jgi:hypothetical protein
MIGYTRVHAACMPPKKADKDWTKDRTEKKVGNGGREWWATDTGVGYYVIFIWEDACTIVIEYQGGQRVGALKATGPPRQD